MKTVILIGLAGEIIGNCDTKIDMGITDVMTAKYFCDLIGVTTVESISIKKSNSIEGELEEYGQKNVAMGQRNLLNIDEILRLLSTKLMVILRGNKPLQLDKMIYKEHPLASKLKDSPISEYHPKWIKNTPKKPQTKEKASKKSTNKEEQEGWIIF